MPSSQKLALNCNSRRRYKGQSLIASHTSPSKFVPVPSVWNRLKIREICMGQYQTFILYISAGNYNYKVIFGKDPFLRTLYSKWRQIP